MTQSKSSLAGVDLSATAKNPAASSSARKRIGLTMYVDLHKRLKDHAHASDTDQSAIVERALTEYFERHDVS